MGAATDNALHYGSDLRLSEEKAFSGPAKPNYMSSELTF
jgi:hypothetical protein